jgi:transcriptional regulator with GAF, ATPase, and Fis domain
MLATSMSTMLSRRRDYPQSATWLIATSEGLQRTLNAVRMVAPTDSTVLIQGETGTGFANRV